MKDLIEYFKGLEARIARLEANAGWGDPLREEVIRLLKEERTSIPALKHYRNEKGCTLYEARQYIDELREQEGL